MKLAFSSNSFEFLNKSVLFKRKETGNIYITFYDSRVCLYAHKGQIIEFEFYRSFTWPNLVGTIFWASLALKFEYDVGKFIH